MYVTGVVIEFALALRVLVSTMVLLAMVDTNRGLRVKYTPEIGFNLLKFIPL